MYRDAIISRQVIIGQRNTVYNDLATASFLSSSHQQPWLQLVKVIREKVILVKVEMVKVILVKVREEYHGIVLQ